MTTKYGTYPNELHNELPNELANELVYSDISDIDPIIKSIKKPSFCRRIWNSLLEICETAFTIIMYIAVSPIIIIYCIGIGIIYICKNDKI